MVRYALIGAGTVVLASLLGIKPDPWALHLYLVGLTWDVWTTLRGLEVGAEEMNPLARLFLRLGPWGLPLLSFLLAAVLSGLSQDPWKTLLFMGITHLAAGTGNYMGIRRAGFSLG
ncbi:hypothetical protein [Thermus caldilimi]|uniref:hypothetical protein n=1 Tax=Thermus caldilimi TaxID=2483360 RepID=UPI0010766113|nr:hypothetical protein [Thermus caldilimi]